MTSLGRIDPVTHHPDGTPIDPDAPASPQLLRELHADLVRGKRRALASSVPFLILGIAALVVGGTFPEVVGSLIWVGVLGVGAFAHETWDWLRLRRADPLTLIQREAQEEAERKAFESDYRLRTQAREAVATLSLVALISITTIVEFVQASRTSFSQVFDSAALVKSAVHSGEWWRLLTATYMHGNLLHLLGNLSTLLVLGPMVEAYEGRKRVPLVYLVSAVGGSICSSLLSPRTSVGASGGILGLAGYLVAAAGRGHGGAPPLIRGRMLRLLGAIAVMGVAGMAFIDNAGHLGGILGGAAVGLVLPRGDERRREGPVRVLGAIATAILVAGAAFTVFRLLR